MIRKTQDPRKDSFLSATLQQIRSTLGEIFYGPIFGTTAGLLVGGYLSFSNGTAFLTTVGICGAIGLALGFAYMMKSWFF